MAGSSVKRMEWSRHNDVVLCTEIRVREPYKFKKCSSERGKIWTEIASTLNSNEEVKFHVTQRGVRERYEGLKAKYLEKIKDEEKASGISPEVTELDRLLEEIIEKESLAESSRESDSTIKKGEQDRKTAEDMRKTAMERMGETKKRSMESEDGDFSVSNESEGVSGSDAVDYLRERAEKEIEIREDELALKREKQDQEASKQSHLFHQQNEMFKAMREQQSQIQNMQVMMSQQQQQQQMAAFMSILERFIPKQ